MKKICFPYKKELIIKDKSKQFNKIHLKLMISMGNYIDLYSLQKNSKKAKNNFYKNDITKNNNTIKMVYILKLGFIELFEECYNYYIEKYKSEKLIKIFGNNFINNSNIKKCRLIIKNKKNELIDSVKIHYFF